MSKKVKCGECYCLMQWMLPRGVTNKNYEYAKVCLEAITKQISRHPVDKTKPDSGYGNYYENARVIVCPNCNGRLKLKSKGKYCDKCGQKLNWENA